MGPRRRAPIPGVGGDVDEDEDAQRVVPRDVHVHGRRLLPGPADARGG